MLETFPISDNSRAAAESAFNVGPFHQVEYAPTDKTGFCYWNVDRAVKNGGGRSVHGWQILWFPNIVIHAMHHAIWERKDGSRVDITAKDASDKRAFSTFAFDDSIKIPLNKPIFVPVKYFFISKTTAAEKWIEYEIKTLDKTRQITEKAIKLGAVWLPGQGLGMNDLAQALLARDMAERRSYAEKVQYWYKKVVESAS